MLLFLLTIIYYMPSLANCKTIKVLRSTLEPVQLSNFSGARLLKSGTDAETSAGQKTLDELTVCVRFKIAILGSDAGWRGFVFSMADWLRDSVLFNMKWIIHALP